MAERYERIFSSTGEYYIESSPVIYVAGSYSEEMKQYAEKMYQYVKSHVTFSNAKTKAYLEYLEMIDYKDSKKLYNDLLIDINKKYEEKYMSD